MRREHTQRCSTREMITLFNPSESSGTTGEGSVMELEEQPQVDNYRMETSHFMDSRKTEKVTNPEGSVIDHEI